MKNFFSTTASRVAIIVIVLLCVLTIFTVKNTSTPAQQEAAGVVYTGEPSQSGLPMFIEFTADWCPYCEQMQPILNELKAEYAGRIEFQYVNIDDDPQMAQQFDMTSVPGYVLIDSSGNAVLSMRGARTKDVMQDFILEGLGVGP